MTRGRFVARSRDFLAQRDFKLFLALFAAASLLLAFLKLADEVRQPGSIGLDARIMLALREGNGDPIGPRWFAELWRDITALGSGVVLTAVTLATLGYFVILRHYRTVLVLVVGVLSAWFLSNWLKALIDRPRPDIVQHFAYVTSRSFPSGHSLMAAVIYPTLAAILARIIHRPLLKLYVMVLALLATVLIGFSRVYLGVHYPTDVVAGWCVGLGWALLCWTVVQLLQKRGSVES